MFVTEDIINDIGYDHTGWNTGTSRCNVHGTKTARAVSNDNNLVFEYPGRHFVANHINKRICGVILTETDEHLVVFIDRNLDISNS